MDVDAAESSASTIQSLAARRRKGISKRKLAFLSPRLGVLNNIPQTVRLCLASSSARPSSPADEVSCRPSRSRSRCASRSSGPSSGTSSSPLLALGDAADRVGPPRSNDKARLGIDRYSRSSPKYHTTIRRHKVAEDGYAHLNGIGAGMKGTVSITFVDQFGQEEAGIDGGGVFKEFLTSCVSSCFLERSRFDRS